MPQFPRFNREPPPPGIVYNTSMTTPDAALALGALWAYEGARRARVGGVCVTGGGYKAALFCDIVNQHYKPGKPIGNDALAVGLADFGNLPPDGPMVSVPVDRLDASGEPLYLRTLTRPADTSLAEAHLRNAITFNAESSIVLSAPASSLARSLQIVAARDLYSEPVRRLILVESPRLYADREALEYLLGSWPTPIVMLSAETAEPFALPSDSLDAAFGDAAAHPVVDAYRAFAQTPYVVPTADLLAVMYAVEPDSAVFRLVPGTGNTDRLEIRPESATTVNPALLAAASAA